MNGFVRWLDALDITRKQAAVLLGKSIRIVAYYESGTIKPPRDTRLLMSAIAEGYEPRLWPME